MSKVYLIFDANDLPGQLSDVFNEALRGKLEVFKSSDRENHRVVLLHPPRRELFNPDFFSITSQDSLSSFIRTFYINSQGQFYYFSTSLPEERDSKVKYHLMSQIDGVLDSINNVLVWSDEDEEEEGASGCCSFLPRCLGGRRGYSSIN